MGIGLHVRFRAIPHLTPRDVLREPLLIPAVVTDPFELTEEAGHNEYDTVGAGRFSVPFGGDNADLLTTTSFDALTMMWRPRWLVNDDQSPAHIAAELKRILRSRKPFHAIMIVQPSSPGDAPEFEGMMTMRSLTRRLPHGEADSRYFSMDLSKYRDPHLERAKHGGGGAAGGKTGHPKLPTKHALTADDTLRSLSKHYYGTEADWKLVAQKNGIDHWGGDDELVKMKRYKVGDKITIPDLLVDAPRS